MTNEEALRANLKTAFSLSESAIEWLLSTYHAFQFFDDVVDGDQIDRNDFDKAIYYCLVGQHENAFFAKNVYRLLPIVANVIFRWQGSDAMERRGNANAKSYMMRAGYYDLVLQAVYIEHGQEVAASMADRVAELYGETYEDYLEEFQHA